MAVFYTDDQGVLAGLRNSALNEQQNPVPASARYTYRFDEATNAGVIADYGQNSNAFAMPGGTLTKDGITVTFNPPGQKYTDEIELPKIVAKIANADPFTTSEQKTLIRVLLRGVGRTA